MDSRCFFFTIDFWPVLRKYGENINVKYSFEAALWDAIQDYYKNSHFKPLALPLRIDGISGGFGSSYNDNFFQYLVKWIRHTYITNFINYFK